MIAIVTDPFPGDDAMARLWLAAWGQTGPASFQPTLERSLAHVGAYGGATLVGFVNVAWDGGIHAFILDTCVDPEHRRQGIALRLVERAAELARQRGATWLHVDFEPHLEAFYRQCGFGSTMAGLMRLDWGDRPKSTGAQALKSRAPERISVAPRPPKARPKAVSIQRQKRA